MMAVLTTRFLKIPREHQVLGLLLFFGLIHGLIYAFLVPPWQHYDEPTRFEYAWLLANQPGHLTLNDYNQSMRREVAASMLEHGFFRDMQFRPNLLSTTEPVWIGISQLNDPPLYFSIVSIPLRLLKNSNIDLQLFSARLVSLIFYLVIIATTWLISREIIPDPNPLKWMIPAFIVLLPGFVDLMTSVNNDVAATVVFSVFLWRSIVLLKNKISIFNIAALLVTLPLAYLTKNTIYVVLPIGFLVILFALLRGRNRRFLWGLLGAAVAIILLFGFRFDNAAYWYSSDIQKDPTRVHTPGTPLGRYALRLDLTRYPSFQSLYQLIPTDNIPSLEGANTTIGAWIWASKPVQITIPYISIAENTLHPTQKINIGTEPAFYAFQQQMPHSIARLWITLMPTIMENQSAITVYYDGLTVIKGSRPLKEIPKYDDTSGDTGNWGGKPFTNILRNGSGESRWPRLQTWLDKLGEKYFPGDPSTIMTSLLDWGSGTRVYYKLTTYYLFTTLWARFGWGNVLLVNSKVYYILMVITFLGVIGAAWGFLSRKNYLSIDILLLLIISLVSIWGLTLIRGIPTILEHLFIPSARYAYPAIVPVSILLNAGWYEIFQYIRRWVKFPKMGLKVLYITGFLTLDVLAISTLILYYYRR